MSDKEIHRAIVIQKLTDGVLTTAEAAEILSLSEHHIKRLKTGVLKNGSVLWLTEIGVETFLRNFRSAQGKRFGSDPTR